MTSFSRGMTLVEVVVTAAISSLVLTAAVVFFGRGLKLSREGVEQVQIVEDARINVTRLQETIRQARDLDASTPWVIEATEMSLAMYADSDRDGDVEKVRAFLEGTELKQGIASLNDGEEGEEVVTVLARSVRNTEQSRPIFTYTSDQNGIIRVRIELLIDVLPQVEPDVAVIVTEATPRQAVGFGEPQMPLPPLPTQPLQCSVPIEIMMVVDGSGSIGRTGFERIRYFLKYIVATFPLSSSQVRIGIVQFSQVGQVEVPLSTDVGVLHRSIDGIEQLGDRTDMANGIREARLELETTGRPGTRRLMVIITDGVSNDDPVPEADAAKAAGIEIFAIGVGPDARYDFLRSIASPDGI